MTFRVLIFFIMDIDEKNEVNVFDWIVNTRLRSELTTKFLYKHIFERLNK